jgi:4-hydroxy-tetrahydrodipicolinate reductase
VGADVAIEFSTPDQAVANIRLCVEKGIPIVVGTTGWYDRMNEVKELVSTSKGSLLWASNFSIGVNLFFRVNRALAALMDKRPEYGVHIDEVHHIHKLDAPSGTAITLARDIDLGTARFHGHEPVASPGQHKAGTVPIASERIGEVTGKHSVTWASANDRIVITHEAFDRSGFAQGAVIAAEWLRGRTGSFTMDDVLGA